MRRLRDAFDRLAGTRITTNMTTGGIESTRGFGLIESWEILRHSKGGRMISVTVTLSDWLYRAVLSKSVLTLSREYFRLRKPLERRIYELARKHCGRQPEWTISIATLHKKAGSAAPLRVFRAAVRKMIQNDGLPDYSLSELPGDKLCVARRDAVLEAGADRGPVLALDTHDAARLLAPGADVYALEAEWRHFWVESGRPRLSSADRAFLGWVKQRMTRA